MEALDNTARRDPDEPRFDEMSAVSAIRGQARVADGKRRSGQAWASVIWTAMFGAGAAGLRLLQVKRAVGVVKLGQLQEASSWCEQRARTHRHVFSVTQVPIPSNSISEQT